MFIIPALIPNPKAVTVMNITSNSAVMDWEAVSSDDNSYGIIRGYTIVVSTDDSSYNISTNNSQVILRNLIARTRYCVKAFAYNEYGDGVISIEHCFNTSFGMFVF